MTRLALLVLLALAGCDSSGTSSFVIESCATSCVRSGAAMESCCFRGCVCMAKTATTPKKEH